MTADQQEEPSDTSESQTPVPPSSMRVRGATSPEAIERGVVLHFEWAQVDGSSGSGDISRTPAGLVITRAEVSVPPPSGITRDFLRAMPLGDVLAMARFNMQQSSLPTHMDAPVIDKPISSGRTLMTDDLLRSVAMAFIKETGPGKGRGATQRMMDRFDRPKGTVQTWIKKARQEGWLAPGPPGRMGAEAGPKLLSWIGNAMSDRSEVIRQASLVAMEYGAELYGVPLGAAGAYNDPTELDLTHRIGVPHLEGNVIAQILFGRTLGSELADRISQSGASEEVAFDGLAAEVRRTYAEKNLKPETDEG